MNRQNGQSLVELALILPVFLLVVVVVLDLGRAYFAYVGIAGAAEQGAVAASDLGKDGTAIVSAVTGEPVGSSTTLSIAGADVTVSCPATSPAVAGIPESCRVRGKPVTVTVHTTFRLVTPFAGRAFGGEDISLLASASKVVR